MGMDEMTKALNARLADLREANEVYRRASWDRSSDIQRNDREIRFLLDIKALATQPAAPVGEETPEQWSARWNAAKARTAAPPPSPQKVLELLKRAQRTIERDYPNGQLAIDIRAALSTNPGEQE
jgi:hypothetical protein